MDNRASVTALGTAYARAYHAKTDSVKIFDDFLAPDLFTPEEHIQFDANMAGLIKFLAPAMAATNPDTATAEAWVMQTLNGPVTLSRSRYTEEALEAAINAGVRQYVILGAGLDTFAFRRPDLLSKLQVFEVDHPLTQAMKRERLAIPGWQIPPQLHLIPIDFTTQTIADVLKDSAYDTQQVTFFSWLGVTYYLTREVVFDAVKAIAGITPKGSTLVFDYMDVDAFIADKIARRTKLMHAIAQQVGEPMQAGFDPAMLAGELSGLGWTLQETISPTEIQARYFAGRNDNYHAMEHVHFARAVVGG